MGNKSTRRDVFSFGDLLLLRGNRPGLLRHFTVIRKIQKNHKTPGTMLLYKRVIGIFRSA